MLAQAGRLRDRGAQAVLIKGGHGEGAESVDMLVLAASFTRLATPRVDTRNTHGTGCTLSSAIAAGLPRASISSPPRVRPRSMSARRSRPRTADGRFRPRAGASFPQMVVTSSRALTNAINSRATDSREPSAQHTVEAAAVWSGRGYFAAAGCQSGRWLPLVFTIHLPRGISGLELSLLKQPLPICDSQIGCRTLYGCALVPTLQGDYPMKKFLLTGVALAALASGSALAADLPARRGMPVKAPEPVVVRLQLVRLLHWCAWRRRLERPLLHLRWRQRRLP